MDDQVIRNGRALVDYLENHLRAIRLCVDEHLGMPALVLLYSGIDSIASLDRPAAKKKADRWNFTAWCENHMKSKSRLGLTGMDLYAARCGILHANSPDSEISRQGGARRIMYYWGDADPSPGRELMKTLGLPEALIKIEDILEAYTAGIGNFADALMRDANHADLVNKRSGAMFAGYRTFAGT